MEPADAAGVMAVQRALRQEKRDGSFKSDPAAMLLLTSMVQCLSSPSDEPMALRRAEMLKAILRAANIDPDNNEMTGPVVISASDLTRLIGQVHTVQARVYSNPLVAQTVDVIYGLLTQATKSTMNMSAIKKDHFGYQLAIEAEQDLYRAADAGGEGFDPMAWWRQNKKTYITPAMQKNINKLGKEFSKGLIVLTKEDDFTTIDLNATLAKARKRYGKYSRRVPQIMEWAVTQRELAIDDARKDKEDAKK